MKTKLLIIGIPVIVIFFIIGWNGIEVEGNITKAQCSVDYDYHLVEPIIKNVLECYNPFVSMSPCGTDSRLAQHNVQVKIIQCLCTDMSENDSVIVDYYNDEFDRYHENEIESNDSEFICTDGAKLFLRL